MTPPTIVFCIVKFDPNRKKSLDNSGWWTAIGLHQRQLIWNLRIHNWKRNAIFQTIMFRSDINLRGCRSKISKKKNFNHLQPCFLITLSSDQFIPYWRVPVPPGWPQSLHPTSAPGFAIGLGGDASGGNSISLVFSDGILGDYNP